LTTIIVSMATVAGLALGSVALLRWVAGQFDAVGGLLDSLGDGPRRLAKALREHADEIQPSAREQW
jgi:hypothetical protein